MIGVSIVNNWKKKAMALFLVGVLLTGVLAGCGSQQEEAAEAVPEDTQQVAYVEPEVMEEVVLEDEMVALSAAPAVSNGLIPKAPGTLVKKNASAVIDYSNTKDGYVMVNFTAKTDKKLKVQVKGPTTTYTYNITPGAWTAFPLSDGNGNYMVSVYQNVDGSKYSMVVATACKVALTDEFGPFLYSNQYVDYDKAPNTVAKAAELTAGITDPLKKVEAVYNFVIKNMTYDKALAASVQSGYLPVLDQVLAKKTGICFDYAALMAGMLRSQGVPCKLVVGYSGSAYHAWISVWSKQTGWVDGAIYFDGVSWMRMDPTYASTGNNSASIKQYIGNGANYSEKYFY